MTSRRLTAEGATQAALTKQRKANQQAAIDAKASEAIREIVDGNDPEQALRALGKRLAERLRSVVGELEASTFLASLSHQAAPKSTKAAKFAEADALLGIKGRGA